MFTESGLQLHFEMLVYYLWWILIYSLAGLELVNTAKEYRELKPV